MNSAGVDKPFETAAIEKVKRSADWFDITYNGWSIGLRAAEANGVEPKIGDTIELFGKGFGFPVRGMRINGQMAYYRTEAEERIYRDRERYGADATEWLARWDRGDGVWSIAMGGFGPGYE